MTNKENYRSRYMADLLKFLEQPEAYPHNPEYVKHVQTHISHAFIVSPYVYKIKKPVDFGFLDYSTLEKRKHYCEREVKLNRRLCSGVYLGVVPIRRNGESFVLNGQNDGKIVEYAVKMNKLPDEHFLYSRVQNETLTRGHLDRITNRLATFYLDQDPGPDILKWGEVKRIKGNMTENFTQMDKFIGETLPPDAFGAIKKYTYQTLERRKDLFEQRIEEQRIIEGHGDLHLEHIHITGDTLCIYDCIEFNERFRFIDLAADLAFLAMDLDFYGRWKDSRYVINRMSDLLNDDGLPGIIDFYKCYRAFVKGKVKSLQSTEEEVPAGERKEALQKATRYFKLCLHYALVGSKPTALVFMGRIASGKSTLADALASSLGLERFSSDCTRKLMVGIPPGKRTPEDLRRDLYSRQHSEKTYKKLREQALTHLKKGESIILDATFSKRQERQVLVNQLKTENVDYLFIETQADEEILRRRLKQREYQDKVVSDARLEDFERVDRHYEPPAEINSSHIIRLDTEQPFPDTVQKFYNKLIDRHLDTG